MVAHRVWKSICTWQLVLTCVEAFDVSDTWGFFIHPLIYGSVCLSCVLFLCLDLSYSSSRSCRHWFQGKLFPIHVKLPQLKQGHVWWWVCPGWWAASNAHYWRQTLFWILTNVCSGRWWLCASFWYWAPSHPAFHHCPSPPTPLLWPRPPVPPPLNLCHHQTSIPLKVGPQPFIHCQY